MHSCYVSLVSHYCPEILQGLWQGWPGMTVFVLRFVVISTVASVARAWGTYIEVYSLIKCMDCQGCAWICWWSSYSICASSKGYMTGKIRVQWIKDDFGSHTSEMAKGSPQLLVVDGHSLHFTWGFLEYARDHNIHTLCLPPHTTHALQSELHLNLTAKHNLTSPNSLRCCRVLSIQKFY